MTDQFRVHQVSTFSNLAQTLNDLSKSDDWEVFQVIVREAHDYIILKAKKKKRGT